MGIKPDIPWPRILVEGVAIVVSILLAFGIQAWWDEKQERVDEQIVLQALLDDLQQKDSALADAQIAVQTRIDSATALLKAGNDTSNELSDESVDRLIGDLLWYETPDQWNSAPLDAIILGGDMSLVQNVRLLERLAYLSVSFEGLKGYADRDQAYHWNSLMPFLSEHVNLAQIGNLMEHVPGLPDKKISFITKMTISSPRDHSALLSMIKFQGLLFGKIDVELDFFRSLETRNLDRDIDEIIVLLESEIEQ